MRENHELCEPFEASLSALVDGVQATFTASAEAEEPAELIVDSGDQQTGMAGQPLPEPLVAVVTDRSFNRLAGVDVTFRVISGGATLLR